MTSLKEQTDAKIKMGRDANPEFMKTVDELIEQANAFKQGESAIGIGQQAPNFTLVEPNGSTVSLSDLLQKGPVVLTFYRGSWCPYCNLQLRALQAHLDDIHRFGAQLVAISPQIPDGSMSSNEINDMDFKVLSDQDAKVAAEYGIAWEVPDYLIKHMRDDRKLDLESINNGNSNILPIPATFVINQSGVIVWRFVDVDYRNRSEPTDIIEALKTLP